MAADLLRPFVGADLNGCLSDVAITGITHDSRSVRPGDLYVGVPGAHAHGADYAEEAAAAGAAAMVSDRGSDALPTLIVDDPRRLLGPISARAYGEPSQELDVIGVTGTNGKTTTTYFLEAGLRAAGRAAGVVGTIEAHGPGLALRSVRTTPEAPELQALFALMRERGVDTAAIEVSSHGLAQRRIDATRFAVAVFTNLTHDHLGFHGDMERYWRTKASLFVPSRAQRAVVAIDDAYGTRLARTSRMRDVVTTSCRGRPAMWRATRIRAEGWCMSFVAQGPHSRHDVRIRLPGRFNVANALNAIAALDALGVDVAAAIEGIEQLATVPGRMQRVDLGQPFAAVVDYAHNPDALRQALAALRQITPGRLALVLGAVGDRDRTKRPAMGWIGARHADSLVVTDDDPFSEEPAAIRADLLAGARAARRPEVRCIPDRAEAIATAVAEAHEGDAVLVAGRGHEQQQITGDRRVDFLDAHVVAEALARAGRRRCRRFY